MWAYNQAKKTMWEYNQAKKQCGNIMKQNNNVGI